MWGSRPTGVLGAKLMMWVCWGCVLSHVSYEANQAVLFDVTFPAHCVGTIADPSVGWAGGVALILLTAETHAS